MTLLEMIERAKKLAAGKPNFPAAYAAELVKLLDQDIQRLKREPLVKTPR